VLDPLVLGPLNGGLLLVFLVAGGAMVARALRRVHRGDVVEPVPLAAVLALPLLLAVVSANVQLPIDVEAAKSYPVPSARQTLWAAAIHRSVLTQLYGGLVVGLLAIVLTIGAQLLTVPGERPRLRLAQAGMLLGAGFWFVAAAGLTLEPTWWLVGRTALYGIAVLAVVIALLASHRRGPGVQLAAISAVAFPLLVAGVDQSTIAWSTGVRLQEIAEAPPSERQALMDATLATLGAMRGFSGLHLALAAGLAGLGPLAVYRERPLGAQSVATVAMVVVVAALGVGFASTWLRGF